MEYLLVKDREQVILGPMPWKSRYIQTELNDLVEDGEKASDYTISQTESGYVDCGDGYELIPVTFVPPEYDSVYQHLAGPFYTYTDNEVVGIYTVNDSDIDGVKSILKNQASSERRRKQVLSTTVIIDGIELSIASDDAELQKYVSALASIGDATISWKFGLNFVDLNAAGLQTIIDSIRGYVQSQFDWEKGIYESIDTASTVEQLKAIVIVEPVGV
jgi:hypothetical protein